MKLKRNCRRLYAECEAHVAASDPLSVCDTSERARGRIERRRVEVYAAPAWQGEWPEIGRVVHVIRSGERDGGPYERRGLYVTSRRDGAGALGAGALGAGALGAGALGAGALGAGALGEVIRSHWHIENRLHWCKDVLQNEDGGGVRSMEGASVLSLLRGAALSVLRAGGLWSPTAARSQLANRVPAMLALLRT